MRVQITGQHLEITPGLKTYIEGKVGKLDVIVPKLKAVSVVATVEKYRHTAEVHVHVDGVELSAKKTTKDMYASVEEAVAALEAQIVKRKDRMRTSGALRRTAAKARKGASKVDSEGVGAAEASVVRVKSSPARVLSLNEALESLETSGKAFLLFRETRGGDVQLLFRRDDGSYALTEV